MSFTGFEESDFAIFTIPGLDARMEALKSRLQPKFVEIGQAIAPYLSSRLGDEFFTHVAKHARRTVNPPNDSWVAWANDKRGYKKHPHFQVGLWSTHLFIWFALIYESPLKGTFAANLLDQLEEIYPNIPPNFEWCWDHTKPVSIRHENQSFKELRGQLERVIKVKSMEVLCGITIDRNDPILKDGEALIQKVEHTYATLFPLYALSTNK